MAKTLQFRRGTEAELDSITGAEGELFVDLTTDTVRVHDGSTQGGVKLAKLSDADDAANTAYANATSYADDAANTAYANATSYADDAANTAYANAVSYTDSITSSLGTMSSQDADNVNITGGTIGGGVTINRQENLLYAWGDNGLYGYGYSFPDYAFGVLGTNNSVPKASSPVTVVGGITNWSSIAAGEHSLGLTDTGELYAWGYNDYGRLGTGDDYSRSSPVTIAGGITNWSSIAAGDTHSLGLTDTGDLYTWGRIDSGALGTGSYVFEQLSPVTVAGGITNWSTIAAGSSHSLGLTDTGVLYAWGENNFSQLGNNTDDSYAQSPVEVAGGITNWSSVTAGRGHNLGLTDTGVLYAWGRDCGGQLGINGSYYAFGTIGPSGPYGNQSSPVTVLGGITNWSGIAAGNFHSLGVTDTGTLYAWGGGYSGNYQTVPPYGQLGTNDTIARSSPVTVAGGITNWSTIASGWDHSLGLTDTGVLYAWGQNTDGVLGTGDTIDRSSPVTVAGGITNWSSIAATRGHSLAISTNESLL